MLSASVQKYDSPLGGRGLVTTQFIQAGAVISEKTSDYKELSAEDVDALSDEERAQMYQRGGRMVLDIDGSGFMNHSCDPTVWWVGDDLMTARRDIQPGEEITYDYGTSEANPWWRSPWVCRCGAESCREVITGRDCLRREFQERYRGHLPTWTEEYIALHRGARGLWLRVFYVLADAKQRLCR